MPRFYFDIKDGKDLPDNEGIECDDLEAARREALRTAGAMLREKTSFWSGETWTMRVRDESGETVSTLAFTAT